MEKERLNTLFDDLRGTFDTETPREGHELRFFEKLNGTSAIGSQRPKWNSWLKPLKAAASIALLCTLALGVYRSRPTLDEKVAEISPEVSHTQFYFSALIEERVKTLENESTPQTRKIIDDGMAQLEKLESNYAHLEQDLIKGGNSKLLLSAMITNFQTRIDLLQDVLDKIESINNLKAYDDTKTTI